MRGNREKCLFCEFWQEYPSYGTTGFCHKNTPALSEPQFPETHMTDWCSKFLLFKHPEVVEMQDRTSQIFNRDFLESCYSRRLRKDPILDHKVHENDRWVI